MRCFRFFERIWMYNKNMVNLNVYLLTLRRYCSNEARIVTVIISGFLLLIAFILITIIWVVIFYYSIDWIYYDINVIILYSILLGLVFSIITLVGIGILLGLCITVIWLIIVCIWKQYKGLKETYDNTMVDMNGFDTIIQIGQYKFDENKEEIDENKENPSDNELNYTVKNKIN